MSLPHKLISALVFNLIVQSWALARPNIILFLVDDLGYSDMGYRNSDFDTPHIDELARDSMDFSQCYVPSPTCSPSRAALLTGKHPARLQLTRHIPWDADGHFNTQTETGDPVGVPSRNWLPLKHITYAEALNELGYYNAFIGKWHLGREGHHPINQGFDSQSGTTNQGQPTSYYPDYFSSSTEYDDSEQDAYLTDRMTDDAVSIITNRQPDRPFILSLWYYSAHAPHIGRKDYVREFQAKGYEGAYAEYLAMVKSVDDSIGRIRKTLNAQGIADDTVIIFLSGQGGYFENPGLRGGKMGGKALYEGGARVPLLMYWPGITQAETNESVVQTLDIFPTLVDIAGGNTDSFIELDGVSLIGVLKNNIVMKRNEPVFGYRSYEDLYSFVRLGDWKLLAWRSGKTELYNLKEDPEESNNVSLSHPAIMESLTTKLKTWERDVGVAPYSGLQKYVEIRVRDFGAVPDDGSDDTRAVRRALNACREHELVRLVFEAGQYDFYPDFASERYLFVSNNDEGLRRIVFDLEEMNNITIDGQGASFLFHGAMNPFVIERSKNVRLENFSFDFSRPFHSEGIILAVEEDYMDVEIAEDHPFVVHRGMLYFKGTKKVERAMNTVSRQDVYGSAHMLEYDTTRRETAFMVRDHYFMREGSGYPAMLLEDRKVRILIKGLSGTAGNTMVFGPNHRDHSGIILTDAENVTIEKVTIHHAGGMGILGQRSRNIVVNECRVTPSMGRMNSTTADATHFVNCTGKIELTNNLFENQKDDATNIHGVYQRIVEVVDERTIVARFMHNQQMGFDYLQSGSQVEFVRGKSLLTFGSATVESVARLNKEYFEISFTKKLPENLLENDAIAEIRDYPDVLIANNIIRNNRARGMLLNCRGRTVVENNYFHAPGAAILFEGDASYWFEQGGVHNCLIHNNVFDNCLFGVWGSAVIDVKAGIEEERESSRYNRNITIEDNTFRLFDNVTLLNVYCVDGLRWRNNTIKFNQEYPDRGRDDPRFIVEHSDNVLIDDPEWKHQKP